MSRLTVLEPATAVAVDSLADFNFRDMGGWHLLTNDWGHYLTLESADFKRLIAGRLTSADPIYRELQTRGFLKDGLNRREMAENAAKRTTHLRFPGPSLHMIVVTLRCNQKCLYCHSSVVDPSRTDTDMDVATAKQTVDFIFRTPNPTICIEFQGGEPLLNWPVVKFIIEYAQAKAKATKRRLLLALVCNFTLMTEERLNYLLEKHVSICTSLDGPAELHNKNRPFLGGGAAQERVVSWLGKIQERCQAEDKQKHYLPGALMTTTRFSFDYGPQIVDEYDRLGLEQIFLRSLSPIGYAKRVWKDIGYRPDEFVRFYERTLDYIIEQNIAGRSRIMERNALILLHKIVKNEDPGFMDLRSPAGAVLGCLAYNYDGAIYVSDEGRMVAHQGDPIFRVGHVASSDWAAVLDHPTTHACVAASTIDGQPMCHQCTFKPYCGVEPVFHYETQKSVFGQMPTSGWCIAHMGVFDAIFRRLRDPRSRAVLESWLERDECRWQESDAVAPGQPEESHAV